jgi:hypothetical protein
MIIKRNSDGRGEMNEGEKERKRIIVGFDGSVEEDGIVCELKLRSLNARFCKGNNCGKIAALMRRNCKASVILCHAASLGKYALFQRSPLYLC